MYINESQAFLYPCCVSVLKTLEVNSKQDEDKEEVKEGAEGEDKSAIQNGTGGKEEEEMEVGEEAKENKAPVQKVVHAQV